MSRSEVEKSTKKGSLAYLQKRINSISRRVSQLMWPFLIFISLYTAISGKLTMILKYRTSRPFSVKIIGAREVYFAKARGMSWT